MPSRHYREWLAYFNLEPFGAWRDNWHAALIAAVIANVNRGKGTAPISVSEFMYQDQEAAERKREDARRKKEAEVIAWFDRKVKD